MTTKPYQNGRIITGTGHAAYIKLRPRTGWHGHGMTGTIRIVSQKTPKDVVDGGGYRRGLTVIYGIIWMDDSIYYAVPKLIFAFTTTGSIRDTSHIVRTRPCPCSRPLVCRPKLISHSLACSKRYCVSVLLKWRMLIISSGTLSGSLQAKYQHIIIINFIIRLTRKKRGLDSVSINSLKGIWMICSFQ